MKTVQIQTRTGNLVERKADVTEYIGSDGRVVSTAKIGRVVYKVVDRNFYGPIYSAD